MDNSTVEVPLEFLCPITKQLMEDPVVAEDGRSYERSAIEEWFNAGHHRSPMSNAPMGTNLIKNYALADAIASFKSNQSGNNPQNPDQLEEIVDVPNPTPKLETSARFLSTNPWEDSDKSLLQVSIRAPDLQAESDDAITKAREPSVLICVLDVSGSMGEDASISSTGGGEKDGLSRLDLVKHSVRTIIKVLSARDTFAIVSFSDAAKLDLGLTKLTDAGKKRALDALAQLQPNGSTNIWDGLRLALEQCKASSECAIKNTSILLLTDGVANINPPRGLIPTLERTIKEIGNLHPVIHTFGFGYSADSKLLDEIARLGNGYFGFIPDCSMVGTIFINLLSNVLAVAVKRAEISVFLQGGGAVEERLVDKREICSLQFGQERTLILQPPKEIASSSPAAYRVELEYGASEKIVTNAESNATAQDVAVSYCRSTLVAGIQKALSGTDLSQRASAIRDAIALIKRIEITDEEGQKVKESYLKDLEGQVSEATSRQDWYDRWGQHYLLCLVRAHELQVCHNFKDPGVQAYGTKLFHLIQDIADGIFCGMEAPVPSLRNQYQNNNYIPIAGFSMTPMVGSAAPGSGPPVVFATLGAPARAAAPAPAINMSAYYNAAGPCFDGNGMVALASGIKIPVKKLTRGLVLSNGHSIACIVKTRVMKEIHVVKVENNLLITPWHPIKCAGHWIFPINSGHPLVNTYIDYIYSVVLTEPSINEAHHLSPQSITINNIECATLGHGVVGDEVLAHPFFGSNLVRRALEQFPGWKEGLIELEDYSSMIVRDKETQLIVGFNNQFQEVH